MSSDARAHDADVAIVGSGVAGALLAYKLAQAGLKVLVLEAGPPVDRAELREKFLKTRSYAPTALDPRSDYAPTTHPDDPNAYLINDNDIGYNIHMTKAVGGTTWHWTAACNRFDDADFNLRTTYGVGVDWPISYRDLVPYYDLAERELGVSAPSSGPEAERRGGPAPMSDFTWPYLFTRLKEKLQPHGITVATMSYARNNRTYDDRPACQGNGTCWPLCPIGAQYSAIVHVDKAREEGAQIESRSLVTRLETDDAENIAAAIIRKPDGSTQRVTARLFVIAANGMESPKLLLTSFGETHPNGLGNRSDQVGRNFMDHASVSVTLETEEPMFAGRGPIAFGVFPDLGDARERRHRAAFKIGIDNRMSLDVLAGEMLRKGLFGDDLDRELRQRAVRRFMLHSSVEVLPEAGWQITLDRDRRDSAGQPRMRVRANYDAYTLAGIEAAKSLNHQVMDKIGTRWHEMLVGTYFGHHPSGTTRMGDDPRNSVVDAQCRSHDHPNLYVVSSSVFPTLGGANGPTLTIAALALRAADAIVDQLHS